jgi:hypothetical protein
MSSLLTSRGHYSSGAFPTAQRLSLHWCTGWCAYSSASAATSSRQKSEMLGHSSIAITLDVYSHVIPGLGEAAALAMEDALDDDAGVGGVGGDVTQ